MLTGSRIKERLDHLCSGRLAASFFLAAGALVSACSVPIDGGSTIRVDAAVDRLNQVMLARYAGCGSSMTSRTMMCSVLPANGVLVSSLVSTEAVDSCAALLTVWPCRDIEILYAAALSCPIKVVAFPASGLDQPFQGTLFSGSPRALRVHCMSFY